jgi:hypothetical protein
MDEICATVYRRLGEAPVGRLLPDGSLEIPLLRAWIRLGWVTSDGSVFSELHPGSRRGWVIDGVGYMDAHPSHPIVRVTPSGVIHDRRGDVAGTVYPPDALAGAALFVALSG